MKNDREFYFGVCEIFEGAVDPAIDPKQTVDLVIKTGFKSMRLWMHNSDLLALDGSGKPVLRPDKIAMYKELIGRLIKGGVTHLTAMSHRYLYPKNFADSPAENTFPSYGSKYYIPFMELQAQSYELIAKTFPEIKFWEVGNEVNVDRFVAKLGYDENNATPETTFTVDEKAQLVTDLCYYCALGIKTANPQALVVMPSPAGDRFVAADFIDRIYVNILSGKYPTGRTPDANLRSYFDILSWHPYNFSGDSDYLVETCDYIYNVAKKHQDDGIKVFITEYGYYDDDLVKFGLPRRDSDVRQAGCLIGDLEAIKQRLPYVETVHIFRLLDWEKGPGMEKTFGLYTSPQSKTGIIPKAKGVMVYKYLKGANADTRLLYKYAKLNIQDDKNLFNKEANK